MTEIGRVLLCALTLLATGPALADPVEDFYRGKTISLYVGFPPGGGYDIYARVLATHLGRHIPGQPAVIVRNMDGGSGVRAAGYISGVTAQDGTSLGMFLDGLTLGKVLGGPGDFDPVKLTWIGRIVSTATVAVVWHTAPAQTIDAAKSHEILVAASVPGSTSSIIPLALNDLIGTRFKVIRGSRARRSSPSPWSAARCMPSAPLPGRRSRPPSPIGSRATGSACSTPTARGALPTCPRRPRWWSSHPTTAPATFSGS
jgi:hypothetical protein